MSLAWRRHSSAAQTGWAVLASLAAEGRTCSAKCDPGTRVQLLLTGPAANHCMWVLHTYLTRQSRVTRLQQVANTAGRRAARQSVQPQMDSVNEPGESALCRARPLSSFLKRKKRTRRGDICAANWLRRWDPRSEPLSHTRSPVGMAVLGSPASKSAAVIIPWEAPAPTVRIDLSADSRVCTASQEGQDTTVAQGPGEA